MTDEIPFHSTTISHFLAGKKTRHSKDNVAKKGIERLFDRENASESMSLYSRHRHAPLRTKNVVDSWKDDEVTVSATVAQSAGM